MEAIRVKKPKVNKGAKAKIMRLANKKGVQGLRAKKAAKP